MSETAANARAGVVIVAAGEGRRLDCPTPKQFVRLAGRPLFAYSLRLFDALPFVSEMVLVLPASGLPADQRGELIGLDHRVTEITGGRRRQDSVACGLAALHEACDVVLVHDAARPFADPEAIARLVEVSRRVGCGLLAIPAPDTVKRAGPEDRVAQTLDRRSIWLAQTPQAIQADLLPRVIEALQHPDLELTDEAALLEQMDVPVALVRSSARNLKVTTREDLDQAEAILARSSKMDHSTGVVD